MVKRRKRNRTRIRKTIKYVKESHDAETETSAGDSHPKNGTQTEAQAFAAVCAELETNRHRDVMAACVSICKSIFIYFLPQTVGA